MYSSIVFTIGLFCYMYMNYKRLFLNWIKQRDPQNKFEFYLQRNNRTLKSHVKKAPSYYHLITRNSFYWADTIEGYAYWDRLHNDWLAFYNEWITSRYSNNSYYVNYDRS